MSQKIRIKWRKPAIFLMICLAAGTVWSQQKEFTSQNAMQKLAAGNNRYASGRTLARDISQVKRNSLLQGQSPYAVVLTCSDSRVPPELIFDAGLGEIFVIRVAGNIANDVELGSIEYAVEHLKTPLIFVMGHQGCGAVKATLAGGKAEGYINSIVRILTPAVNAAKARSGDKENLLDQAIAENVSLVASTIVSRSHIVAKSVEEGKVKIVQGIYRLDTGKVDLMGGEAGGSFVTH